MQWGGIPGRLVANSSEHFVAKTYHGASASGFTMEVFPNWQVREFLTDLTPVLAASHSAPRRPPQIWSKDLPAGKLAVLIINISEQPQSVSISLSKLDFPSQAHCRDLYTHQDSTISNELSVSNLAPHDSYFVILQGV